MARPEGHLSSETRKAIRAMRLQQISSDLSGEAFSARRLGSDHRPFATPTKTQLFTVIPGRGLVRSKGATRACYLLSVLIMIRRFKSEVQQGSIDGMAE